MENEGVMTELRDRFWLWGQDAGCYHRSNHNQWKLPGSSRMTPAEGAFYLGIPNIMIVRFENVPAPADFRQYALPLRPLKRVVWSIIGDSGSTENDREPDLEPVLELAGAFPNVTGAIMDDFFRNDPARPGRYTPEQVAGFRARLHAAPRPLDLSVVLYAHNLELPVRDHLAVADAITFWTWSARDLKALERNFRRMEELAPRPRKLLGLYMWDFGGCAPMPMDAMEFQCRKGLEWLRAGRVDGLVFLANCIADLDLEPVEYARRLIGEVGEEPLPKTPRKENR